MSLPVELPSWQSPPLVCNSRIKYTAHLSSFSAFAGGLISEDSKNACSSGRSAVWPDASVPLVRWEGMLSHQTGDASKRQGTFIRSGGETPQPRDSGGFWRNQQSSSWTHGNMCVPLLQESSARGPSCPQSWKKKNLFLIFIASGQEF